MLVRILAAVVLAAMPILASVNTASACSCAYNDASEILKNADGAFVGQIISTEIIENPSQTIDVLTASVKHTFKVESVVRGEFEQITDVFAPYGDAGCGLSAAANDGARMGIMTRPTSEGLNGTHLCLTVTADNLLAFAGDSTYPPLPISSKNVSDTRSSEISGEGVLDPAPVTKDANQTERWLIGVGIALLSIALLTIGRRATSRRSVR